MLSLVQKEYKFLDVMKFMMAIVVVAIHTRPECSFQSPVVKGIFEAVYSIAVPFFFMASGFLLFRKVSLPLDSEGEKRIKKYLKKTVKLYLIWTAIYLPLTMYGFYMDGMPLLKSIVVFIRNILLVGENYMSWPLWYLLALIVAVGIIYLLLKLNIPKNWVLVLGILMAIVGVVLDYYKDNDIISFVANVYFNLFQKTRNGFFVGFLYVSLGLFCSQIDKISFNLPLLLLAIGIIGTCYDVPLSHALIVVSLFIITISIKDSCGSNMNVFSKLRLMSSIVYFVHMFFIAIFVLLVELTQGENLFYAVIASSLILAFVLLRYRSRRVFKMCFS